MSTVTNIKNYAVKGTWIVIILKYSAVKDTQIETGLRLWEVLWYIEVTLPHIEQIGQEEDVFLNLTFTKKTQSISDGFKAQTQGYMKMIPIKS